MSKMIGFSRPVNIKWLNKTVELILEGKEEKQIKEELNEYLAFEIDSKINIRKTREILMNIWVRVPEDQKVIRDLALKQYPNESSTKELLHWCMLLLAYPVFTDAASLIGKISVMQDTFSSRWLKDKLFDVWGERATLLHSITRITNTMVNFGVLKRIKTGEFSIEEKEITSKDETVIIAMTIVALKNKAYYEVSELSNVSTMFPFSYNITHQMLHDSDVFSLSNFGGKVVVSGE